MKEQGVSERTIREHYMRYLPRLQGFTLCGKRNVSLVFSESGYTLENISDSSDFSDHHAVPVLTGMVGSEKLAGGPSTFPTHSSDTSPLELLKGLVERHGDSWCLTLEELDRETGGRAREIIHFLEERGDRYCYGV